MKCFRILLVTALFFVPLGCGSAIQLSTGSPLKATIEKHRAGASGASVEKTYTPCVIRIRTADRFPGKEDSLLTHVNVSKLYYYPVRVVFEKAFQEAVYRFFEAADSGELESFTVEVKVPVSLLTLRGQSATYRTSCDVTLRSPDGKLVSSFDLTANATSPFDGATTPQAVWDGAYNVAYSCLKAISQDPRTHVAIETYRSPGTGVGERTAAPSQLTIDCDLRLYELNAKVSAAAGLTERRPKSLRQMAAKLAKKLVDDLAPADPPRLAVLVLKENTKQAKANNLGKVFAQLLQTELHADGRVLLVAREELEEFLNEHDLNVADIVDNPEVLKQRKIKLSSIDYLLLGGISATR